MSRARSYGQKESGGLHLSIFIIYAEDFFMSQKLRPFIFIKQHVWGMFTIRTFPLCLLSDRLFQKSNYYIGQSQGKREESKTYKNKASVKEQFRAQVGSNVLKFSLWKSNYFYFCLGNPTNVLKKDICDSWCSFTLLFWLKTQKVP